MTAVLRRVFSVEHMVKHGIRQGELPTTETAYKNLIQLALPAVAEMVLMSLIGSIDTMMVGMVGKEALAAVGLTGQPRMLMMSLFFALNIGVTAIVARRKGEGNQADANQTLRNALVLLMGMSVVMMALALTISRPLILFAGAQPDTIDMADTYFRILMYALPINAATMCINAAQRGVGNTRITMYVNVTANLVNVIFNYLLINGHFGFPRLGVAGAAIATVIGYCVGFLLALYSVLSSRSQGGFLRLSRYDDWRLKRKTIEGIAHLGGNAMIEQIAMRVGFLVYAMIVAALGTDAFAAHNITMQFLHITFTFGDGIGVASTALVGQNLGQKRPDLSQMYGKIGQRIAMTVSIILLGLIIGFREPLVLLFNRTDDTVISLATQVMVVVALIQPLQTTSVVISGCLRGAGDTRYVARIMMLCVVVIRPVLSFVLVHLLGVGLVGAWLSTLVDQFIRMILMYRRFASGKWFSIKV